MNTVAEIEAAIEKLPPEEQRAVADWLANRLFEETPEMLAADVEKLLDMDGATEFPDAMASFQDLFTRAPGVN